MSEERIKHLNSTVCYLRKDNKILMIKFNKKFENIYAPPGGKFEKGESPLDCIIREFREETGLTLINPKLQGISYWHDLNEGIIFVYTADEYYGDINESKEGTLEWINFDEFSKLKQFEQNKKFTPYLFKNKIFEGKFLIDNKCNVIDYKIRDI